MNSNARVNDARLFYLAEQIVSNLPIGSAALEEHEALDKIAFIFEDSIKCSEVKGEAGAGILVSNGKVVGFTVGEFSSFHADDITDKEVLFMMICLDRPGFAEALYQLIVRFEAKDPQQNLH